MVTLDFIDMNGTTQSTSKTSGKLVAVVVLVLQKHLMLVKML